MIRHFLAVLLITLAAADALAAEAPRLRRSSFGGPGGSSCGQIAWTGCPLAEYALPLEPPFVAPPRPEHCDKDAYARYRAELGAKNAGFNFSVTLVRGAACTDIMHLRESTDEYSAEHKRHQDARLAIYREATLARWEAFLATCTGTPKASP